MNWTDYWKSYQRMPDPDRAFYQGRRIREYIRLYRFLVRRAGKWVNVRQCQRYMRGTIDGSTADRRYVRRLLYSFAEAGVVKIRAVSRGGDGCEVRLPVSKASANPPRARSRS